MTDFLKQSERLDDLQLKELKIIQNPLNYCFTSDAVLLSSFSKIKKGETVFDFCSGSGVIAILLYGKNEGVKKIYCVEIQKELAEMSQRSIALNNLQDYITVLNIPVQKANEHTGYNIADVVVCNPPYSKAGSSIINTLDSIAAARHEIHINVKELINSAKKVLKFKGRLYIVHQAERTAELIFEMINAGIEPKTLQMVAAREDKKPHLVLIEGIYGAKSGLNVLKPLNIFDNNNAYTDEAKKMYNIK